MYHDCLSCCRKTIRKSDLGDFYVFCLHKNSRIWPGKTYACKQYVDLVHAAMNYANDANYCTESKERREWY